jgi:Flp pilus assembly protein TadG
MKIRGFQRLRADRGSTLVEFSLVGFMFIIVLLGVVEIGRMVLVFTTVANAARAGARYAIVHGGERSGPGATGVDGPSGLGNTTQVETVVKNFASAGLLDTSQLTITVAYPDAATANPDGNIARSRVSVTVTYTYDPLVTYFNSILGTTMGSTSQGVITY